jgi:predicted enzyme related to lactoylglutathione lyase
MKAAEKFYHAVIGWKATPFPESPNPYATLAMDNGAPVAGLMTMPGGEKMPPFWAMYIAVPKLEDAVTHIKKLGGSEITPIIDVPTVGRLQMVKDPQGAGFYVMQPSSTEVQPEGDPAIGEASWHELMTTDAPAAMKFYQDVFGWEPSEAMDMGEMGKYQMFNRPHGMIGGMMNKSKEMADVPPYWGIYFLVPDITSATERVKANGGQIINGPMEVPGGDWIVNAMDPQGAMFSMHAKKK